MARCKATTGSGDRCKRTAVHGEACSIAAHRRQLAKEGAPEVEGHDGTRKCGATTRSGGKCGQTAGWGTEHPGRGRCKLHGGCTPTQQKKVEREIAEEAVATYGLPREVDPHTALLEEIYRTAGHVDWLRSQLVDLEDKDLIWGVHEVKVGGKHPGYTERASPNVWLKLYHQERRHLVDVCRVAIAAGIAERQVRLAEEQGRLIAEVIRGVLGDLDVADDPRVPQIVRKHLSLVAGGIA